MTAVHKIPVSNGREDLSTLSWDSPSLWAFMWHSQDVKIIQLFGPYQALCFKVFYKTTYTLGTYLSVEAWNALVMQQQ